MPPIPKQLQVPKAGTLRQYGLTVKDWFDIVRRQGGVCPICEEPLVGRKLAVDHAHVRGFKRHRRLKSGRRVRVMPREERVVHVRGVLHSYCNRFVRGWLTLKRARAILNYLTAHDERLNNGDQG